MYESPSSGRTKGIRTCYIHITTVLHTESLLNLILQKMKPVGHAKTKLYYHKIMSISKILWNIHHLAVMDSGDYNSVLIDSSHGNHHGIFHVSISLTLTYPIALRKNIREQTLVYFYFFRVQPDIQSHSQMKYIPNHDTTEIGLL